MRLTIKVKRNTTKKPSAERFRLSIFWKLMKRVALKAPHEWHAHWRKGKWRGFTEEKVNQSLWRVIL